MPHAPALPRDCQRARPVMGGLISHLRVWSIGPKGNKPLTSRLLSAPFSLFSFGKSELHNYPKPRTNKNKKQQSPRPAINSLATITYITLEFVQSTAALFGFTKIVQMAVPPLSDTRDASQEHTATSSPDTHHLLGCLAQNCPEGHAHWCQAPCCQPHSQGEHWAPAPWPCLPLHRVRCQEGSTYRCDMSKTLLCSNHKHLRVQHSLREETWPDNNT